MFYKNISGLFLSIIFIFFLSSCGGGSNANIDVSVFNGKWYGPCFNNSLGSSVAQSLTINSTSLISTLISYKEIAPNCVFPDEGLLVTSDVNVVLDYNHTATVSKCEKKVGQKAKLIISSIQSEGNTFTNSEDISQSLKLLTGGVQNSLLPDATVVCRKSNGNLLFAGQEYTQEIPISDKQFYNGTIVNKDFSDLIPFPDFYDDFTRETNNPTEINNSISLSGDVYRSNKTAHFFKSGRYVSDAQPGLGAVIAYVDLPQKPNIIAAEFIFTSGDELLECNAYGGDFPSSKNSIDTDGLIAIKGITRLKCKSQGQNAVIGTTKNNFGGGSVQLAIYHDHWRLFVVEKPIVDPYAVLASGNFEMPLKLNYPYKMSIQYNEADSSLIVKVPNENQKIIKHVYANKYWGNVLGMQMRRPSKLSGKVEFLKLAAGWKKHVVEDSDITE